jgi:hypothetical protein
MDSIARARAHSLAFRRSLIAVVLPIAIVCSVVERLWSEIRSAICLAKLDVQENIETAKLIWRK